MEIQCKKCGESYPKSRRFFPWGPKKPLMCTPCIESTFYKILWELQIDFESIREEANGNV